MRRLHIGACSPDLSLPDARESLFHLADRVRSRKVLKQGDRMVALFSITGET